MGDPEEGGWRWGPRQQETGSPGDFAKLFQARDSAILWGTRPGFAAGGPPGSGDCGLVQRGTGSPGPWRVAGAHCLDTLPSSRSPTTVQLGDPSLLRLQGRDSSPGTQGLRGMESAVFFCLFILNSSVWVILHCYGFFLICVLIRFSVCVRPWDLMDCN